MKSSKKPFMENFWPPWEILKIEIINGANIVYECWSINQGSYIKVTRKYGFVWHLVIPSYKSQTIIHMI
jgi:hypothetical protein